MPYKPAAEQSRRIKISIPVIIYSIDSDWTAKLTLPPKNKVGSLSKGDFFYELKKLTGFIEGNFKEVYQ
jgi:hypothetical protein